jgi:hypothetical protein
VKRQVSTDGSDLYVRLYWYDGTWKSTDWTYQAANGTGNAPTGGAFLVNVRP